MVMIYQMIGISYVVVNSIFPFIVYFIESFYRTIRVGVCYEGLYNERQGKDQGMY